MKEIRLIEVKEGILSENDRIAAELRRKLTEKNIFLLNLMSSPGAGKTGQGVAQWAGWLRDRVKGA